MTNVIIFTLDALRKDRLEVYGSKANVTPHIDAVAKDDAFIFDRCYTLMPATKPAHLSILTGLDSKTHGVRKNHTLMSKKHHMFSHAFKEKGYTTAGFPGMQILSSYNGLKRGFDYYKNSSSIDWWYWFISRINFGKYNGVVLLRHFGLCDGSISSGDLNISFREWFYNKRDKSKPFFTWLHYFDLHRRTIKEIDGVTKRTEKLYNANIRYMDTCVADVINILKSEGMYDDTIIIFLADHGESIKEIDGRSGHGGSVAECDVNVPCIVRIPGIKGKRITALARNIDVLPFVFSQKGWDLPYKVDGVDPTKNKIESVFCEAYPPYSSDTKTVK